MSDRGVLVHEWLAVHGGSEGVFDVLVDSFPEAEVLLLWSDRPAPYPGRTVRETWLARTALRRHKALAMPFATTAWRGRRPGDYDWALVSSHQFAHHVSFAGQGRGMRKYVYVHSPARYLWAPELDSRGDFPGARALAAPLKTLDRRRAQEATSLAANSSYVAQRIEHTWGREARVIHPPIDVLGITGTLARGTDALSDEDKRVLDGLPSGYVLGASRFVTYKRLDLVIETADVLGLPAVIAGGGPEEDHLRHVADGARVPVHFVPVPSSALLHHLYARASVYVFPPVEDFGMMPVEALAAGTPVVVGPVGGAREIVDGYDVGAVAEDQTSASLARAAERALGARPDACRARAAAFDTAVFRTMVHSWVDAGSDRPTGRELSRGLGLGGPA